MIKAILEANDTEFKSEGQTILEAIRNIQLNFLDLKTKCNLTIKQGKKSATLHLVLFQGRKLLRNPTRQKGFAYQLESLLK